MNDTRDFKLFFEPEGRLRLSTEKRSYLEVKPAWAAPMSEPNRYLSLRDGANKEIALLREPEKELSADHWLVLKKELEQRYLTARITRVLYVKMEFGEANWHVETNRGERWFKTESLHENAQWLESGHLLLVDTDGDRYEIPDVNALDAKSQSRLFRVV
jgi:hypothetical protein